MFLTHRPSAREIEEFIQQSSRLSLSYEQIGIAKEHHVSGLKTDEAGAVIGCGPDAFEKAKLALTRWRHFEFGWVELFPRGALIEPGTVAAVLVHHLGFWSLNGCRVVYTIDDHGGASFGFAYGTLTNHAECGEEIFEISFNEREEVIYRIRAVSKPRAAFASVMSQKFLFTGIQTSSMKMGLKKRSHCKGN